MAGKPTVYTTTPQRNANFSPGDNVIELLQALVFWNTPPTTPVPKIIALSADGPLVIDPAQPNGVKVWTIQNNGSNPIKYWYQQTNSIPADYEVINPGTERSYSTHPPVIYASRQAGDNTATLTYVTWF